MDQTNNLRVLHEAQKAFAGEANRMGIKDEDDVVKLVKEIRTENAQKDAYNHTDKQIMWGGDRK